MSKLSKMYKIGHISVPHVSTQSDIICVLFCTFLTLCNRKVPVRGIILLSGTIISRCLQHGCGPTGAQTGISPAECQLAGLLLLELRAIHAAISHSLNSECPSDFIQHIGPVLVYVFTPSFSSCHICLLVCQENKSFH